MILTTEKSETKSQSSNSTETYENSIIGISTSIIEFENENDVSAYVYITFDTSLCAKHFLNTPMRSNLLVDVALISTTHTIAAIKNKLAQNPNAIL